MSKGCSNSERLIRIDERVQVMKEEDIPEIKRDIKDMKEKLNRDHYRIKTLEKTGGMYNFIRFIKAILRS